MSRGPRLIAVMLVVGASLWALHLATALDEPFGTDSAVVIGIGLLMFSLIAAVGILVARGRWARNLARAVLVAEALLAVTTPLTGWSIAGLVATALGIVGVQGRWLDGWLRRFSSADGPGPKPIVLVLGCLALVPAIGVAFPAGLELRQGIFGAVGVVVAWGYSKAKMWALWAARLALVPVAALAAWAKPVGGATLVLGLGVALAVLAWSSEARTAISPLLDELPGPRRLKPRQPEGGST